MSALAMLLVFACSGKEPADSSPTWTGEGDACVSCHEGIEQAHGPIPAENCVTCHGGNPDASTKAGAHVPVPENWGVGRDAPSRRRAQRGPQGAQRPVPANRDEVLRARHQPEVANRGRNRRPSARCSAAWASHPTTRAAAKTAVNARRSKPAGLGGT